MKLAYLILAHRNVAQLARLIQRLDDVDTSFFVHFDKKSSNKEFELLRQTFRDWQHVHFVPRQACYWGHVSLVETTLKCVEYSLEVDINYEYGIMLSAQDYPLKSNAQIKAFLSNTRGTEFLENYPLPHEGWGREGGMERVRYYYFHSWTESQRLRQVFLTAAERGLRLMGVNRRLPNHEFYGGSNWWCLTRPCLEFLTSATRSDPGQIDWFRRSNMSGEVAIQTILMNSPFRAAITNNNLRYIDWSRGGSSPKILTQEDFEALKGTEKLFARKFNQDVDPVVLEMLDRLLERESPANDPRQQFANTSPDGRSGIRDFE